MTKGPCKDCPDRVLACAGSCPKYISWRKAYDAERAALRREQKAIIDANSVIYGKKPRRRREE